ncbi:MAG: hypothetical protein LBH24_06405 [Clostridiales bacterium]|nr:hypothetical protein [Clostridiales bacterium]
MTIRKDEMNDNTVFRLNHYDKAKPFSDFLPGIAGADGIPMWTFFVNRAQCVCSFGVENKDGAILEFMPANKAYQTVGQTGFRTFLGFGKEHTELFTDADSEKTLISDRESLTITERATGAFEASVTYVQLAQEDFPALLRRLTVKNISDRRVRVSCADGLAQMLPLGAKYEVVKNVTNLMSAYSTAELVNGAVLFRHEYTTADVAEVKKNRGGNFYTADAKGISPHYIYDPDVIFGGDLSLREARGFYGTTFDALCAQKQSLVFKLPCAFALYDFELAPGESFEIDSAIGAVTDIARLEDVERITHAPGFFDAKRKLMQTVVDDVLESMGSRTADKTLDAYFKQSFFDNVLRGGMPKKTDGGVSYLYARKHGDLEREYNWFTIPAQKNSCGNGNFRDVCQNRRNDIFFFPFVGTHNIELFYALLQADGYNPLVVEPDGSALFSEGYWSDHFVYPLDLLENYLRVYPETREDVLLGSRAYTYFDSGVYVLPQSERLERTEKGIRSYRSIVRNRPEGVLKGPDGNPVRVTLLTKLYGLALVKSSMLDPACSGIEMDGGKPGWNDSLNGLPGLNGSSVPEAIGLYRLIGFLLSEAAFMDEVELLSEHATLFSKIANVTVSDRYKRSLAAREELRLALLPGRSRGTVRADARALRAFFADVNRCIAAALSEAKREAGGIYPTFFVWKLTDGRREGEIDFAKLTRCRVGMPLFLEGAAKGLLLDEREEGAAMHERVLRSELYDRHLGVYKTGVSLETQTPDIGRVRIFSAGLYERESCFVHLHYKYILGLLEAGHYELFYHDIKTALVCLMDPAVYGRNSLQNSSFIVSSASSDPMLWGRGFQPRLSGANAELLSMYVLMFAGPVLFTYNCGVLRFTFAPALHRDLFDERHEASALLFNCRITYVNPSRVNTYDADAAVTAIEILTDAGKKTISGASLWGADAEALRNGTFEEIRVMIEKKA